MRRTSSRRPALKRLENRIVLGIDRQNGGAAGGGAAHEQRAGANEAFLVGERDRRAALGRGKRRRQACGAGDRRHDPIGRPLRGLDHCLGAGGRFDAGAGQFGFEFAIGRRRRRPRQNARRVRAPVAPAPPRRDARSPPRRGSGRDRAATDRRCSSRSSRWRRAASPCAARTPIRLSPKAASASSGYPQTPYHTNKPRPGAAMPWCRMPIRTATKRRPESRRDDPSRRHGPE